MSKNMELNGTSFPDVEFNGESLKHIELDGVIVFTRIDLPVITTQPVGGTIEEGNPFTVSIVASDGSGTLTYEWYLDGSAVANSNSDSFTFPSLSEGSHSIYCKVSNERGEVTSDTVAVQVESAGALLTVGTYAKSGQRWYGYDRFPGGNPNYGQFDSKGLLPEITIQIISASRSGSNTAIFEIITQPRPPASIRSKRIRVTYGPGNTSFLTNAGKDIFGYQHKWDVQSSAATNFYNYLAANNGKSVKLKLEWV